jgi:hypothetical protein
MLNFSVFNLGSRSSRTQNSITFDHSELVVKHGLVEVDAQKLYEVK